MRIAILSDIHGNSWALSKVLKDLEKRKPDVIVNLGDSLYGPLNPKETFELIKSNQIISISGNQDRVLLENIGKYSDNNTIRYILNELSNNAFDWLKSLPKTHILDNGIYMCHGTPESDITYLLENLVNSSSIVNEINTIEEYLRGVSQKIVFCGHSHTRRFIQTPLFSIINPGSVGLPAYSDDLPVYHRMQNFNNQAHYCFIEIVEEIINLEQISLPYDYQKAVNCALKNNRLDWAGWIRTGWA